MQYNLIRLVIPILFAFLITHCTSPIKPNQHHIIGLQPIGQYAPGQLQFIQKELHAFFKVPVVILKGKDMPVSFINRSKGERYSADTLIKWLADNAPDSITKIVGLTHKDIFTTVKENGHIKGPAASYAVWGIFGLGYQPGRSSVISDHRLQTSNIPCFKHRLRTIVIHELGHNQGLPHCPTPKCIMNDANERIQTVDQSGDTYCSLCKGKL
ncbi:MULTISPECIES: matrixin family metalloprotease [Niastella]|uniref:Matrixin family metalloprotease n=1 Tax=Niastella soli TaxID=2821487 RepID=A0ABS3Z420_9BACT|nr:matrixin family metalloprotease [Niastella soli]MBO9204116.1 matrixin family metalloprotease [Niastella soli]